MNDFPETVERPKDKFLSSLGKDKKWNQLDSFLKQ